MVAADRGKVCVPPVTIATSLFTFARYSMKR